MGRETSKTYRKTHNVVKLIKKTASCKGGKNNQENTKIERSVFYSTSTFSA